MQDVQTLAKEVLKMMTQKTRDNGDSFYMLQDEAPEWMQDLCQDAHNRMLPDDHKYQFIFEALVALEDQNEDEARDSIEGDGYNSDLTSWLASHLARANYVDEAVSQGYIDVSSDFNTFDVLRAGQWLEKTEVFDSVLQSLQNRLDEIEAA